MLVKYYGLVFDNRTNSWLPRVEFISNGLFRMTQPKYLNDKGSEARLWPYFNEFSPADYIMTCRANDLNPYYYFRHLFTELPKRAPSDELSDLLPWNVDLGEAE
ncbi:transposase domain-containing protein [Shewanella glacialimarina]|nr:transposase domain-containing protein [Shewanella glacialimarina]